jgi:putative glutamate/gamma-aminobutyrate antiporter
MNAKRIPRTLSVCALAMINLAAIGSVKNWPLTAEYGLSSLFFLLLASLTFFVPVALVSAELATGWPKAGGVFVWVKEAFGHRTGFLAIWLLWMENVIWYPTLLAFIAATLAYVLDPRLVEHIGYTVGSILFFFWGATLLNLRGMRLSSWISSVGVVCGTFLPGLCIIALGLFWYVEGRPLQIAFAWDGLVPNLTSPKQLAFFTGVMLSLCGLEMSAIHARDVKCPQKDYPRALLLSVVSLLGLSFFGVLAIAMVVPREAISLTGGSMQAFAVFLDAYGLARALPFAALVIAIGALGSMSTWLVGPTKGLLAAAEQGDLPPVCRIVNRHGMPVSLMLFQGVVVSLLSLVFFLMPTVSSAYWILTVLVAQLYLVMYVLLFAAAIKLRYKRPDVVRPYKIPGGTCGMWLVAGLGMASALLALAVGFLPPEQLDTGSALRYVGLLTAGLLLASFLPWIILRFKKPHWKV